MLIEVETTDGPRKVKVCDYCKTVCCQSRFCSGRCARNYQDRADRERQAEISQERTDFQSHHEGRY
jgi:hypothetical protein